MSAQRSVQVTFNNQTSQALELNSANLAHGIWGSQPPQTIPPNSSANWESESQGFMTGVQGDVIYSFQNASSTLVTLNWDNPFVGSGTYTGNGTNPSYSVNPDLVQDGNNASVIYTLTQS